MLATRSRKSAFTPDSLPLLPPNLINLYYRDNPLINEPTKPLSNWIKQHNRTTTLKRLLNDNR